MNATGKRYLSAEDRGLNPRTGSRVKQRISRHAPIISRRKSHLALIMSDGKNGGITLLISADRVEAAPVALAPLIDPVPFYAVPVA